MSFDTLFETDNDTVEFLKDTDDALRDVLQKMKGSSSSVRRRSPGAPTSRPSTRAPTVRERGTGAQALHTSEVAESHHQVHP